MRVVGRRRALARADRRQTCRPSATRGSTECRGRRAARAAPASVSAASARSGVIQRTRSAGDRSRRGRARPVRVTLGAGEFVDPTSCSASHSLSGPPQAASVFPVPGCCVNEPALTRSVRVPHLTLERERLPASRCEPLVESIVRHGFNRPRIRSRLCSLPNGNSPQRSRRTSRSASATISDKGANGSGGSAGLTPCHRRSSRACPEGRSDGGRG